MDDIEEIEEKRIQKQKERNKLKLKLQEYGDIYEYKAVKWGPFRWKKRVLKVDSENALLKERREMICSLDENARPPPSPIKDELGEIIPGTVIEDTRPEKELRVGIRTGVFKAFQQMLSTTVEDVPDSTVSAGLEQSLRTTTFFRTGKKKSKKKRKSQVEDFFQDDEPPRPPTPPTYVTQVDDKMKHIPQPPEEFQWDLRETWPSYVIYVSSTCEDMKSELEVLYSQIYNHLSNFAGQMGKKIMLKFLQDGLTDSEANQCSLELRFREIETSHCVVLLQGRKYGQIAAAESRSNLAERHKWLATYPADRSYQELEAALCIRDLRSKKGHGFKTHKNGSHEETLAPDHPEVALKRVLILQRAYDFMADVPADKQAVFRELKHERDALQRRLRNASAKSVTAQSNSKLLQNYKCSFKTTDDKFGYQIGDLIEFSDFVKTEIQHHISIVFPVEDKPTKSNTEIDSKSMDYFIFRSKIPGSFVGRKAEMDKVIEYCDDEHRLTPMLIIGSTGSGKTAFLMNFVRTYLDLRDPVTSSIVKKGWRTKAALFPNIHFTTATSSSRDPARMLHKFCSRMSEHFYIQDESGLDQDYEHLCQTFPKYCNLVSSSFQGDSLLVVVDSLEEFDMWRINSKRFCSEPLTAVDWVPERLMEPPFFPVRIILSIDPVKCAKELHLLRLKQRGWQSNEIELSDVSMESKLEMLASVVKSSRSGKTDFDDLKLKLSEYLNHTQRFVKNSMLFYAILKAELSLKMRPDDDIRAVKSLIEKLPDRLSSLLTAHFDTLQLQLEGAAPYLKDVLQYLSCARKGLLETEIWELIKLKDSKPKYHRFRYVLFKMSHLLQTTRKWDDLGGEHVLLLAHTSLAHFTIEEVIKSTERERKIHRELATMFYHGFVELDLEMLGEGKERWMYGRIITDEQARGLSEAPYHAIRARMVEEVKELLCSIRFIEMRVLFGQLSETLEDYRVAVESLHHEMKADTFKLINDFYEFVKVNAEQIVYRPSNTFQLAANSPLSMAPSIASRFMMMTGTETRGWLEMLNKLQKQSLTAVFRLGSPVLDLSFTSDSRYLACVTESNKIHVFDTHNGVEMFVLTEAQHSLTCCALFSDATQMVTGSAEGFVTFWDLIAQKKENSVLAHRVHGKQAASLTNASMINRVKVSSDGECMVTAGNDFTLNLLDPQLRQSRALLTGHRGSVTDCDISNDGQFIVSASLDRTLRVWNIDNYECLQVYFGHHDGVLACSFGGYGHDTFASSSMDGTVRTWQTNTGVVLNFFRGHKGNVNGCAMGMTGPQVISTSDDGTVRLWDTSDGSQIDQFSDDRLGAKAQGHQGKCTRCLLSYDCLRAVSAGEDGDMKIWKVKVRHEKRINCVKFSADETRVITCSMDKTIRSFEVLSTTELAKIVGHVGPVNKIAVSPGESSWKVHGLERRGRTDTMDTCVIASASDDNSSFMLNMNSGLTLHHLKGHMKAVVQVQFSQDGRLVATASADASIGIWEAASGELRHMLGTGPTTGSGHTGDVNSIMFIPDTHLLVSISNDTSCRIWDVEHGSLLSLLSGHKLPVYSVDFNSKTNRLVTGSKDKTLRIWNVRRAIGGKVLRGHTAGVLSVAFSTDGRVLLTSGRDKFVRVWTVDEETHKLWIPDEGYALLQESNTVQKKLKKEILKAMVLTVTPNGRYFAIGYDNGYIEMMQVSNYIVDSFEQIHEEEVKGISFTKDSVQMCTCSLDRTLCIWKLTYNPSSPRSRELYKRDAGKLTKMSLKQKLALWAAKEQYLLCCCWNASEEEIAVGCEDSVVYIVDVKLGQVKHELRAHTFRITCLAYYSDGSWIVSGSYDKSISIWHADRGLLRKRIRSFDGAVLCLAFLPFGPFVCAGSADRTARIFHILTGDQLFSFASHSLAVRCLSISASGFIATGSDDKEVRIWDCRFSRLGTLSLTACRMPWSTDMGTEVMVSEGHRAAVINCKMDRSGEVILSASEDWTMILWDATHGTPLQFFIGHKGSISECFLLETEVSRGRQKSRIGRNIRNVVSGSMDGTVRVWDVLRGFDICYLKMEHAITSLDITKSNEMLAVGDSAGNLQILRLRNFNL